MRTVLFIFCILSALHLFSQPVETVKMVKYDKNYVFKEGVYLTFDEFRQNNPAITDFKVSRGTQFSDQIALEYPCVDKSGNATKCLVRDCWGYVQNNTVFIAQGTGGYFFRLHIIGALIHYYAIESYSAPYYDYSYGYPTHRSGRQVQTLEYLIEFDTGKKIVFNYKNFSAFLLEKDKELYDELQKSKKKRKMIYHFLIRYNEKHPVWFYKL